MPGLKRVYCDQNSRLQVRKLGHCQKGKILGVGGVDEVHMALEDSGTSVHNCDSVPQLAVYGPELIPKKSAAVSAKTVDKNCVVGVHPAPDMHDNAGLQLEENAVGVDGD